MPFSLRWSDFEGIGEGLEALDKVKKACMLYTALAEFTEATKKMATTLNRI